MNAGKLADPSMRLSQPTMAPVLGFVCLPLPQKERIKLLAIADSTQIAAATTNGASSGQQGKEGKHIGSRQ